MLAALLARTPKGLRASPAHEVWAWLVRLRWLACAGEALAAAVVHKGYGLPLPLGPLSAILLLTASGNALLTRRLRHAPVPSYGAMTATVVVDLGVATALLALCGGPHNPFAQVSLVHVALAAAVLPPQNACLVLGVALLLRAGLLATPLPQLQAELTQTTSVLRGALASYAVAACAIVYVGGKLHAALARSEGRLALAQARAARDERLNTLAALAVSAAHEMGTPLAVMAIAAGEMERRLDGCTAAPSGADAVALREDAALIRQEVGRCRQVLRTLVDDAEAMAGDAPEAVEPADLLAEALSALHGGALVRTAVAPDARALFVPRRTVVHGLRAVVHNALQASAEAGAANAGGPRVAIRVLEHDGHCIFLVADAGEGMSPSVLAKISEPFFTTKGDTGGNGLGLFLARTVFERLGGGLHVASRPGGGTTVSLQLPLTAAMAS